MEIQNKSGQKIQIKDSEIEEIIPNGGPDGPTGGSIVSVKGSTDIWYSTERADDLNAGRRIRQSYKDAKEYSKLPPKGKR